MACKEIRQNDVDEAISLLYAEGSISIPMSMEQYHEAKDYKFTVIEHINKSKEEIDWERQERLFYAIRKALKEINITTLPDEGIIRLK